MNFNDPYYWYYLQGQQAQPQNGIIPSWYKQGGTGDMQGPPMPKRPGFLSNPLVQAAGLGMGSQLLGGLADMFGGKSDAEKRSDQVYGQLQRGYQDRSDVIDPMRAAWFSYGKTLPAINKYAEGVGRRMNLDSGAAQGAITEQMFPTLMSTYGDAWMDNERLKQQRKMSYMGSLAGAYGGR